MKKTLLAVLALTAGSIGLHAEDPKSSYSITSDFTYTTQYFFRGVLQQKSAFQPSVTFAQGPLSLGVWTSQALESKSTAWSQGNEVDLFGSYSFALAEGYTASVGGTYYYYMSARPSLGEPKDTYESALSLSAPLGPLAGKVSYFHDFVLKSDTFQFDLGYSKPLADGAAQFDAAAYYGLNDIGDGNGDLPGKAGFDYAYYGVTAAVSGKISEKLTLKVSGNWANVSDLPQAKTKIWLTVGVTAAL
jgi:uncharacterized protein (TIGR02001 family)